MEKSRLCFFACTLLIIVACSSVKKAQQALNAGDYDRAIATSVKELRENKVKSSHQPFILMLEEAFSKASRRDLEQIAFLEKEDNPANLTTIYESYITLRRRQEDIKPLLPLFIVDEQRQARFQFKNYSSEILSTKNRLSKYLYKSASQLISGAKTKYDYRQAYNDLDYLEQINPSYKDVKLKMDQAHSKGTDFVAVAIKNRSDKVIPKKLEKQLLDFDAYDLNDFWTVYHSKPQHKIDYDYRMKINFTGIDVSPERIKERELIKEREISDGWEYQYDENGNVAKDNEGNDIKTKKYSTVQCRFYEFTQFKSAYIRGNVTFEDLSTGQVVHSYPLSSEYIFEHIYANYEGDKRALSSDVLGFLEERPIAFPSSDEMIYSAGENLKSRIKEIVIGEKFNY